MTFTPLNQLVLADGHANDAFGRLRISQLHPELSSMMIYDDLPSVWETELTGAATAPHTPATASVALTTTTAINDVAVRQTRQYYMYRPGQSQLVQMTFNMNGQVNNARKRVGYFDPANGIFLELNGTTDVALVIRSSTSGSKVNTRVVQSSWNIDPLDGTGPSGITLDWSKVQIFAIDFQWLGVGRVRCSFSSGGQFYYAHEFNHANSATLVYMSTPSLPVRYEIANIGATAAGATLTQICSSVFREGSQVEEGMLIGASVWGGTNNVSTTPRTILTVRKSSNYIRTQVRPVSATIMNRGTAPVRWSVYHNVTMSGTLTGWTVLANSAMEYSTSQVTFAPNTGHLLGTGFIDSSTGDSKSISIDLHETPILGATISGVSDTYAIVVESLSGTQNGDASMQWLEVY